jgi:hypothetical protein
MSEVVIETESLRLILPSTEDLLARIESLSPADRAEVSPDLAGAGSRLGSRRPVDAWILHGGAH